MEIDMYMPEHVGSLLKVLRKHSRSVVLKSIVLQDAIDEIGDPSVGKYKIIQSLAEICPKLVDKRIQSKHGKHLYYIVPDMTQPEATAIIECWNCGEPRWNVTTA